MQEINAASILEFTLPPTNPQLDAFARLRRPVRLLSDNTVLFEGDVVERTTGFDGSVTVKCQDALGWLNDVVVPKPTFSGTVAAYWEWLIAKYNDNTSNWRHVKAGNVTVTGDVSVLYEKEFPTIFELVRSLVTLRGGYVSVRYYASDIYLDYVADLGVQSEQDIRYGVNLLNLEDYFSGEDAFTRIYPRGKNGLDISSVNGGVPYLYDANRAITNGYGIIGKCVDFDTDDAATLKALRSCAHAVCCDFNHVLPPRSDTIALSSFCCATSSNEEFAGFTKSSVFELTCKVKSIPWGGDFTRTAAPIGTLS